jgi:NADP-dependent 3-hydroxy acid dehydrogenase YdfG
LSLRVDSSPIRSEIPRSWGSQPASARNIYEQTEVLAPKDIADGVAYMGTRPRHTAIGELWIMPTDQV